MKKVTFWHKIEFCYEVPVDDITSREEFWCRADEVIHEIMELVYSSGFKSKVHSIDGEGYDHDNEADAFLKTLPDYDDGIS